MPKTETRIASLLPSATEIVCLLGLEKNLVGITHECDFPPAVADRPHLTASRISHETMSSREIDHAVRSQLDGHGSIYDLDEKRLSKLDPDLIITQELCEVCAVSYKTVRRAARLYVADARIVSLEPQTIEDIFANIRTVGDLCRAEDEADRAIRGLRRRLDDLRERAAGIPNRPRTLMLEWLEPPFAPGHWVPEQVAAAGGQCLLGTAGEKSRTTTYQEIYESNPEIIVLIPCGYYQDDILRQLPNTEFPAYLREVAAFRNRQIWAVDAAAYFSRPGPRVVDGAEILARIFHPDIFGPPDKREAVRVEADRLKFDEQTTPEISMNI